MHLKDFEEHMTLILDGHEILREDVDMSKKLECIELGRRSYQVCREYFKDEGNNLHRWLVGQPTVVKHPVTGDYMELIIEEGFEALHNLLEFCKLQNSGLIYDTEYFAPAERQGEARQARKRLENNIDNRKQLFRGVRDNLRGLIS